MASWSDKMATFQVWDTCIDLPSSSGFKDCHIIVKICIVPLSFSRLMMSVFSTALSSTPKTRISLNIGFPNGPVFRYGSFYIPRVEEIFIPENNGPFGNCIPV